MNLEMNQIKKAIDEVVLKWEMSGSFLLIKDGEVLHNNCYGYSNRELNLPMKSDTKYTLDYQEEMWVFLTALIAIDNGLLKLTDKLDKFIPEYKHSKILTIENLLRKKTGIIDFYHNILMIELEKDPDYIKLSKHDQLRKEKHLYYSKRSFNEVFEMVKSVDLEFEPGLKNTGSETNKIFLLEILRRLTGEDAIKYFHKHVFEPLNISPVYNNQDNDTLSVCVKNRNERISVPKDYLVEGIFDLTTEDMLKLMRVLCNKQILSKRLWNKALKYEEEGEGIVFSNANGYDCLYTSFLGFGFCGYFNHKTGIAFANLVNEEQIFKFEDNQWEYFRKDIRSTISSLTTYPRNTKMVKLDKQNFWSTLNLSIKEDQNDFVLDAKTSVAMGLMYRTKKIFAQMEGNLVVGVLVLDIDKKKNYYDIDIVLIDKKYQGRGYGKLMVKWAVDYLKNEGAKTLLIGVNRNNIGAQKIYMSAGFKPKSIDNGGMQMAIYL